MVIAFDSYQGRCPFRASKLIGDTAEAHGETRTISYLMPVDSEKVEGNVSLVPTNEDSEDNLSVDWRESGKVAVVDMIRLLAHKSITIPDKSNMVIELFADTDSTYGKVIGMKFVGATFEPQKERPKKAAPKTGTGTQTNNGTQNAPGGQNTAAGSQGQTPPEAKGDTTDKA
ncbi:MAG: hypothetical protein K0R39_4774 [Symbiobacteriaceae bacterium]|jgi:hypothetical protein|nr:hypothetical protein [Symbiobacteriaceae bacterium]